MGNAQSGGAAGPGAEQSRILSFLQGAGSAEEARELLEVGPRRLARRSGRPAARAAPSRRAAPRGAAPRPLREPCPRPCASPAPRRRPHAQAEPGLIYAHTKDGLTAWHLAAQSGDAGLVGVVAAAVAAQVAGRSAPEKVLAQVREAAARGRGQDSGRRAAAAQPYALPASRGARARDSSARVLRAAVKRRSDARSAAAAAAAAARPPHPRPPGKRRLPPREHGCQHARRGHGGGHPAAAGHPHGPHD
jgi:hypothetical protein